MTTYEQNVKAICDECYHKNIQQILIDFIQEDIEDDLVNTNKPVTRDAVLAASYQAAILLEVYDKKVETDIDILTRLISALDAWANDIEGTNILLGIPREQ